MMHHHNNSVSKALVDLFPNIGLDASKLRDVCKCFLSPFFLPPPPTPFSTSLLISFAEININIASWNSPFRRKRFFERYAKEHSFDPRVPENWYSQSRGKILETKVSSTPLYISSTSFHFIYIYYYCSLPIF